MNQFPDSASCVAIRPAPLFASSWIALFRVIRCSLGGRRDCTPPRAKARCDAEPASTRH